MSGGPNTPAAELAGAPPVGEHGALSCGKPLEFSGEARARLGKILSRYPTKQAALLPTLWLAQEEWGWISREAVDHVAAVLELSPAFVWGVVTFYTMYHRAPVGRHLIQVCTSISCHLNGAEEVFHECCRKLGVKPGQVTADGKFSVVQVECLAQCDKAPAVMVGGDDHAVVTKERLDELLGGLK